MPRPLWNGYISFGLVNIPVKLFKAVKPKTLSFHQLRRSDGCRIRLKRVCAADDTEVSLDNIVKGYEIAPDQYVVITPEEIEALYPKPTRSIEIQDFVKIEEIDPVFFDQSYYIVPNTGADKAYKLLIRAMQQTNKIAIAQLILRNKQHLSAIRPYNDSLMLSTMFFAEELVDVKQIGLPENTITLEERELKIAIQLIESLSAKFTPEKYQDEYKSKVLELIERKSEGQDIVVHQAPVEQNFKVIDLMAALEASLSALNQQKEVKEKPKRRKKVRA